MVDIKEKRVVRDGARLPFGVAEIRRSLDPEEEGRYSKDSIQETAWRVSLLLGDVGARARSIAANRGAKTVSVEDIMDSFGAFVIGSR